MSDKRELAAARARRRRERNRAGRAVIGVEIDEVVVFELLRAAGFIADRDGDDRAALARGLERAIESWTRHA